MKAAVLILCGGDSKRMGKDKASLPFGDETLLARVARIARCASDEVWLLAREGQVLPADLPEGLHVARDPAEGRGPLAGIVAGLRAMRADVAYVTSCDVPLLEVRFIETLIALAKDYQAVVPRQDGHLLPTTAVYHRSILPVADTLLARDELRPRKLLNSISARVIEADTLRDIDPELQSLMDCDTPEDYQQLLRLADIPSIDNCR